jgi:hypothetical protein
METTLDTIEGTLPPEMWFHYDVGNDVLYLRLQSKRRSITFGEETDDGLIFLRDTKNKAPVGITVVNWWKRFGKGSLPDSIREIQRKIKPLARRLSA